MSKSSESTTSEPSLASSALLALDAVLVTRIIKWDNEKRDPEKHLHGCDPKWFDGFCEGKIRELQNVREIIRDLDKGDDLSWAIPKANDPAQSHQMRENYE